MPGNDLRKRLGLRSTWFSIGVLSLSPPSTAVVYGARARLTGVARGLPETVLQQQAGADWQEVGSVKADDQGALSVVVKPAATTRYRLASWKATSAPPRVPLSLLLRLSPAPPPDHLRCYV